MSSEKTRPNPRDNTYQRKAVMMLRPAILDQVFEYEGDTFNSGNLTTRPYQPNYSSRFVGKNLNSLREMRVLDLVTEEHQKPKRYRISEGLEDLDPREVPDDIRDMVDQVFEVTILNTLEKMDDPVAAVKYMDSPGIDYGSVNGAHSVKAYRSENKDAAIDLLDRLSLIEGEEKDNPTNITADPRDIDFLTERKDEWREAAELLESEGRLPERQEEKRDRVRDLYE